MRASVGKIELEYDTFGSTADPALLLVMGLGTQMIAWQESFCQMFADRGFFVIRFDNRDVGLSTKLDGVPSGFSGPISPYKLRYFGGAPYTLSDMAADAVGLLDHLEIGGAHIVGASMGGMIVQQMAIDHPDRVLSLTSIMSTTGSIFAGRATPEALKRLFEPSPTDRDSYIDDTLQWREMLSPHFFDEDLTRRWAEASHDRSFYPEGTGRQLAAIFASGNRTRDLKKLTVPTLVIHGEADPLVTPSGGKATAAAIPGAELKLYPKMGHGLPEALWPRMVEDITSHASAAIAPVR